MSSCQRQNAGFLSHNNINLLSCGSKLQMVLIIDCLAKKWIKMCDHIFLFPEISLLQYHSNPLHFFLSLLVFWNSWGWNSSIMCRWMSILRTYHCTYQHVCFLFFQTIRYLLLFWTDIQMHTLLRWCATCWWQTCNDKGIQWWKSEGAHYCRTRYSDWDDRCRYWIYNIGKWWLHINRTLFYLDLFLCWNVNITGEM